MGYSILTIDATSGTISFPHRDVDALLAGTADDGDSR